MITTFEELIDAAYSRMEYFHQMGCRISDHGLEDVPFAESIPEDAERVFHKAMWRLRDKL